MIPPVSPPGQGVLPQVDDAALPREVRKGSEEDKKLFKTALAFERQLLTQLAESMNKAAEPGEDEESGDSAGGAYGSMVPTTMADSLVQRGGTGMALDLYRSFKTGAEK